MSHPDLTLDVRGLPAPEPMHECLEKLWQLEPGQRLQMYIDREPHPLFSILTARGYSYQCTPEHQSFLVTIWSDSQHATRA
ncbi:DUF2249 domain-containing protein [Orrella sp. 11846]|uniref:DUF2249 domain-containing protein n=1 Tax=Orrella sp. 11846 TaxID=3409913 RepID=UPI003B5BB116